MSVAFCVVLRVGFCTCHFVMVPLNMTYIHCLQHSSLNISSIYIDPDLLLSAEDIPEKIGHWCWFPVCCWSQLFDPGRLETRQWITNRIIYAFYMLCFYKYVASEALKSEHLDKTHDFIRLGTEVVQCVNNCHIITNTIFLITSFVPHTTNATTIEKSSRNVISDNNALQDTGHFSCAKWFWKTIPNPRPCLLALLNASPR